MDRRLEVEAEVNVCTLLKWEIARMLPAAAAEPC